MVSGVGAKCACERFLEYGCVMVSLTSNGAMNVAFSSTHGGCLEPSSSERSLPRTDSSHASSRRSRVRLSARQDPLRLGAEHTRPVQPPSCHGTRADRC